MKKIYTLFLAVMLMGTALTTKAQFSNIYNFADTAYPYGSLTAWGNKLFGFAYEGGVKDSGYIFSINKDGTHFKHLWDCRDTGVAGNANGSYPFGNLVVLRNKLYGFFEEGGPNGIGLIFSIDSNGHNYKDLYDFTIATGGWPGWGPLTLIGGKFFGALYYYGANGTGAIFSIDTNGTNYKDIYDFTGHAYPEDASFAVSGNKLFGMTYEGGTSDSGYVYSVDTSGANFRDLYDFNKHSGCFPEGHLTLLRDRLYGLTQYGGAHDSGTMFFVDTNGTHFTKMMDFNRATGDYTFGSLLLARGRFYGMAYWGGANDSGDVFSIDTNGTNYTVMHSFNGIDGNHPWGNNLMNIGDTLYGMTPIGGSLRFGTLFRLIDTSITASVNSITYSNGSVKVYPNPSDGKVVFSIQESESRIQNKLEVYNMMGETVYAQAVIRNSEFVIDLSNNANGIYLYRVISENGSLLGEGKIVLQK